MAFHDRDGFAVAASFAFSADDLLGAKLVKRQDELVKPQISADLAEIAQADISETIISSFHFQPWRSVDAVKGGEIGKIVVVEKRAVARIDAAFDALHVITVFMGLRNEAMIVRRSRPFHADGFGLRLARTHVSPDHPAHFCGGIPFQRDFFFEIVFRWLVRHIYAMTLDVEFPAMIDAT